MSLKSTPLPGFPSVFGNKNVQVEEHAGPSSYPTGGEVYDAAHLGWGGFDWVEVAGGTIATATSLPYPAGNTTSGSYIVVVLYTSTAGINGALPSVKLKWFVATTGAEASGDLSAEVVRLFAIGV
jgi:hypothetical protein